MHEFSIAAGIVDSLLAYAEAHQNVSVLKVRVLVGELTCVDAQQLQFCYSSITEGLPLEGSELEVERQTASVQCRNCAYEGPPKYWEDALAATSIPTLQCPQCGSSAEAVRGHECEIKSLQILRQDNKTPHPVEASQPKSAPD